jgi:hypothetical protein
MKNIIIIIAYTCFLGWTMNLIDYNYDLHISTFGWTNEACLTSLVSQREKEWQTHNSHK